VQAVYEYRAKLDSLFLQRKAQTHIELGEYTIYTIDPKVLPVALQRKEQFIADTRIGEIGKTLAAVEMIARRPERRKRLQIIPVYNRMRSAYFKNKFL
jgi:hypothetical protein